MKKTFSFGHCRNGGGPCSKIIITIITPINVVITMTRVTISTTSTPKASQSPVGSLRQPVTQFITSRASWEMKWNMYIWVEKFWTKQACAKIFNSFLKSWLEIFSYLVHYHLRAWMMWANLISFNSIHLIRVNAANTNIYLFFSILVKMKKNNRRTFNQMPVGWKWCW